MAQACAGRQNELMLTVYPARLELEVVVLRKAASDGVGFGIKIRRGDVVREILMNAAGEEIGGVESDLLVDLAIHADSSLHVESGAEVGIDSGDSRQGRVGADLASGRSGNRGVEEVWIIDDITLLVDAVLVDGSDDVGGTAR